MADTGWHRLFRKAPVAGPGRNLVKTLLQTSLFWLVFLFVIPWGLAELEGRLGLPSLPRPWPDSLPWYGFGLAGALGLWSGATMAVSGAGTPLPLDGARRLVVRGPYAYVRNPMAVAGLTQGACVGLHLGSPLTLVYVLAGGLLWNYVVRPIEERYLETEFGDAYRRYRDAVRCWWPRRAPYLPEACSPIE